MTGTTTTAFRYAVPIQPSARGSQGAIHVATRSDGCTVALKVAGDAASRELLAWEGALLEAIAAAGVEGVVEVLDRTEVDGRPALVMPLYAGQLGTWMHRARAGADPDALSRILDAIATVARTLGEVHRLEFAGPTGTVRLVHRDVKPENIFLDRHGRPRLGDFGCAVPVEGLRAIELSLFGTPGWAPLDQVLPGRTIPDPSWDTFAACNILYAALTGARPAHQADPRELLTPRGRELWALAERALVAGGEPLRRQFARERFGATAADLIDCTGRSGLVDADRALLATNLDRLGAAAGAALGVRIEVERALWAVLVRGLSPVAHPSPPNRWHDGRELADELQRIRAMIEPEVHAPGTDGPTADLEPISVDAFDDDPPPQIVPARAWPLAAVVAIVAIAVVAIRGGRPPEIPWDDLAGLWGGPALIAPGADGPAFRLDRTEVTVERWAACAAAGLCPTIEGEPREPVVGVSLDEAGGFCMFEGGRLPTLAEWRRAAGTAPYPWGEATPTCGHAIGQGCAPGVEEVGTTTDGATREGVLDLAGNAAEWTADGWLVGGSWSSPASVIGAISLEKPAPADRPPHAGLRCAW